MAAIYISSDDLSSFHAKHFSTSPMNHFSQQFLGPVEEVYQEEEEDDGLGYYEDGTKRTLTDEQASIAIFRHSEIETLLRDRRHAHEARDNTEEPVAEPAVEEGEIEEGELEEDGPINDTPVPHPSNIHQPSKKITKKEKKARQAKEKGFFKQNVKPDLRKRTWDKVETGLENLDYDEMENTTNSGPSRSSQRRRISYEDD
ncbi:hypothetical protein LSUB1_G000571 [Lachnellula subtilissima]|uniref:Uncharacterized protein n=1 Tax=Lachnellula subtilissima TaxID=602034 RepID=A0A8H8UI82_9HELO|nr:hypothetical protein LSUB1_G000571 [Lachnellula subtilissima]